MTLFVAVGLVQPMTIMAATRAQSAGSTSTSQMLLLPVESTTVELQTHTVDMTVGSAAGELDLVMGVDALYRLNNATNETVNLLFRLVPEPSTATVPADLVVLSDGQPVNLQPAEGGGSIGQILIAADARADVRLAYTLPLDARLPLIRYDARPLADWPGQSSMRIAIALPAYISSDSWLRLEPDDWRYQTGQENGVKWLTDQQLPNQPIVLQFIHPTVWNELSTAQQLLASDDSPTNSVRLGSTYHGLYDLSASAQAPAERFFAQALAAYAGGIESGAARGAAAEDMAPLHAGAAALYRTRVVDKNGVVNPFYAELMVQSAREAAQGNAAGDAKQAEMLRWQAEGLNILLRAANDRRDWQTALTLVEQLNALPRDIVDPAQLAEAQRTLQVQQALQLLADGDRNAAVALAGPEIVDATLVPPANAQSLFASWQVTMTSDLSGTELVFLARPAPERIEEARQALSDQVTKWQDSRVARKSKPKLTDVEMGGGIEALRLNITLSSDAERDALAALVSPLPQWILLRTVLGQAGVDAETSGKLIWREVTLRQPLDLRSAGDQWDAMAANLSREATQLEQAGAGADPETALRSRIQAINYRNAAQAWEEMAKSSWVVTTLRIPAGVRTLSRTWLTTPSSPARTFEFSTSAISGIRLLAAAMVIVVGLLIVTALLWWLL